MANKRLSSARVSTSASWMSSRLHTRQGGWAGGKGAEGLRVWRPCRPSQLHQPCRLDRQGSRQRTAACLLLHARAKLPHKAGQGGRQPEAPHQGVNCGLCGEGGAPCGSRSSNTGTTSLAAWRAAEAPLWPSNTANSEYWSAAPPQAEQRASEGASEASPLLPRARPHNGEVAASLPGQGR